MRLFPQDSIFVPFATFCNQQCGLIDNSAMGFWRHNHTRRWRWSSCSPSSLGLLFSCWRPLWSLWRWSPCCHFLCRSTSFNRRPTACSWCHPFSRRTRRYGNSSRCNPWAPWHTRRSWHWHSSSRWRLWNRRSRLTGNLRSPWNRRRPFWLRYTRRLRGSWRRLGSWPTPSRYRDRPSCLRYCSNWCRNHRRFALSARNWFALRASSSFNICCTVGYPDPAPRTASFCWWRLFHWWWRPRWWYWTPW